MVDYLKDEDRVHYSSDEKNAYAFVIDHVKIGEPCCLAGHADRGKTAMFRGFTKIIKRDFPETQVLSYLITKETSQNGLIDEICSQSKDQKTCVICHFSSGVDVIWVFAELRKLRDTHGSNFVFVCLADLDSVYKAFVDHNKQLLRSLYVCKPLNYNDTMGVLHSFEVRFAHPIHREIKDKIFDLSGGGAGLMKSLFLLTKTHDLLKISDEQILQDTSIQYRLEALKNDIPEPIRTRMESGLPLEDEDTRFLTVFGVLKANGTLFSPLLEMHMNIKKDPLAFIAQSCTSTEISIIELFQQNSGTPLSRDQIAQCLWGSDWEEKYSDWAIDQAIHRLRTKLRDANSPYSIQTKKGVGFVLKKN